MGSGKKGAWVGWLGGLVGWVGWLGIGLLVFFGPRDSQPETPDETPDSWGDVYHFPLTVVCAHPKPRISFDHSRSP